MSVYLRFQQAFTEDEFRDLCLMIDPMAMSHNYGIDIYSMLPSDCIPSCYGRFRMLDLHTKLPSVVNWMRLITSPQFLDNVMQTKLTVMKIYSIRNNFTVKSSARYIMKNFTLTSSARYVRKNFTLTSSARYVRNHFTLMSSAR